MSKHMIGYIRVSTEEQERSGLGVEAQEAAILAECERREWTVELFRDLGCSGKHVNPELRRALDLLDAGQFDGLIVAKLDRLARSVRHASAIIDDAIRRDWALVALDNALDLTTPGGRAMANMLATFAELERDLISSRTKEALAARKARGQHNGRRSAIPAGVLRRIVLAREDDGSSFGRIASDLTADGVLSPTGLTDWSESTVRRAYASATDHQGNPTEGATMSNFNPGAVVTVDDLEVGDTIFQRQRKNATGLPVPTHPITVTALTPIPNGRVRVEVRNANSPSHMPSRLLGDLPATREFRAAVQA